MIVIASTNKDAINSLRQSLGESFDIYDGYITNRHSLDLCLRKINFDALIADMNLFTESGIHEISEIRLLQPKMRIILLSKNVSHRDEISAILFGAKAFCPNEISSDLLIKVVNAVLNDEVWVDRLFVTRLLAEIEDLTHLRKDEASNLDSAVSKLTPRESQIAKYVSCGDSNRKISESLKISERTVKAHLGVIFRKIGITDRLQLALYMNRHQQLANVWHEKKFQQDNNK
jgi:two-component system nitrate/nitrite response regulator NarL